MNTTDYILETRQLTRTFSTPDGPLHAVNNLTLNIERGKTVALLGSNGAGKSTLINMMINLDKPSSGFLSVCGQTAAQAQSQSLVTAIMQSGGLLPEWTVRETIVTMCAIRKQSHRVDEIAQKSGVQTFLNRHIRDCSGGQVQRLRLALALITPGELLILDEPTAGMDPHARRELWNEINALHDQGITILCATHFLDEATRNADDIVVMHKGQLLAHGTLTEILDLTSTHSLDEAFFALTDTADSQISQPTLHPTRH
ncbi:ABC transporter ATP-binding protein [Alloscardovia omnicolens]|uniref:ABC transporter ATP-binding protein n=1 Tax=Alloscardovia omnicolens TaxID=419015 RepID=UPI00254A65B1|nr:ABC transporter ATP-binding protein [Alloscardovia omnicolens]MDK6643148.1 ABC transporter ATP-binding protein [Alloscardovia omnicolens]MDK8649715.1 ABC transporter ATP-binding protein [Alloscardovia omnicolens]